uniref:ATP synthase complex subunit 8 n=1 Tax=Trigonopterus sp. 7 AH-2016 TaxID=1903841 RepID=A0A343C427_9CUCU|nr:ATP synthase F0 subunit 8 [Trigonopterus sp. 7 AH-2016]
MPQMAPMNWTLLYIFIIFLFFLSLILSFFLFYYTPKSFKPRLYKQPYNWKW